GRRLLSQSLDDGRRPRHVTLQPEEGGLLGGEIGVGGEPLPGGACLLEATIVVLGQGQRLDLVAEQGRVGVAANRLGLSEGVGRLGEAAQLLVREAEVEKEYPVVVAGLFGVLTLSVAGEDRLEGGHGGAEGAPPL